MYKLLNRTDFFNSEEIEKDMEYYISKYSFDGFELIKFTGIDNTHLKNYIKGYHMRFFPSWLEFYNENFDALYEELKDKKYFKSLCGGENRKEELLEYYQKELEAAKKLEVEYVVLHACNSKVIESMTYEFKYSDREVLDSVISLINELFDNEKYTFKLLLENLWWPGLKLTSKEEAEYILKNIKYKNTGFMLDTGHMINNNRELKNSNEAVAYIKQNIENLEEYKNYIYGIHLNYSLSGEYVKNVIEKNRAKEFNIEEIMSNIYTHINSIDYHDPFENEGIIDIINSLPIEYLVYEMIAKTKEELENKIERQDKVLKKFYKNYYNKTKIKQRSKKEEKMKKLIAFPTKDGVNLEKHFGHSDKFVVYTIENGAVLLKDIIEKVEKVHGAAAKLLKEKNINILITGHMASTVYESVKNNGIEIILGIEGNIENVLKAYLEGTIINKDKEEYVHHYADHSHSNCKIKDKI